MMPTLAPCSEPLRAAARATFLLFCVLAGSSPVVAQGDVPLFRYTGSLQRDEPTTKKRGPATLVVPPGPKSPGPEPKLIGPDGIVQDYRQWIAIIDMTRSYGCTGTMIGPRVLLTAAHCVEKFERIRLEGDGIKSEFVVADCQVHPSYRFQSTFRFLDYALCHLAAPFPGELLVKTNSGKPPWWPVKFERLSLKARDLLPGRGNSRSLLLTGYGCSTVFTETIDHELRAGLAMMFSIAPNRVTLGSPLRDTNALLCRGDSGGPAYRLASEDPKGRRVIVGVNSANILERRTSFVAPTSAPAFIAFFNAWKARWGNPKVCGVDLDTPDCQP
jgi:Trypsin